MSARSPAKFSSAGDFNLWIRRFEIYLAEAAIPGEKWARELLSLLEDEPFRVVAQLGLADDNDYEALKNYSNTTRLRAMSWSGNTGCRIAP